MDEESLNGDTKSSAVSDEEDIEEDGVSLTNSSSATPPPSNPSEKLPKQPVKRRRETDSDADTMASPLPPPPPPPPAVQSAAHPLLSADLIQSLQYFALLRQSLPNGTLPIKSHFSCVRYSLKEQTSWRAYRHPSERDNGSRRESRGSNERRETRANKTNRGQIRSDSGK